MLEGEGEEGCDCSSKGTRRTMGGGHCAVGLREQASLKTGMNDGGEKPGRLCERHPGVPVAQTGGGGS